MGSLPMCLLCLIGLPASGKTALSQKLKQEFSRLNVENSRTGIIHICYDSLIPIETQKEMATSLNQRTGSDKNADLHFMDTSSSLIWRQARQNVLRSVEDVILQFKNLTDILVSDSSNYAFIKEQILRDNPILNSSCLESFKQMVIIIDDNLYYRSMRYEYFQLARKYTIGFCQLFIECSKKTALLRNINRNHLIPESVIEIMNEKLESPLPDQNFWELNSLVLNTEENIEEEQLKQICNFIIHSLNEPVKPSEDISELQEQDRKICSTSVIHQIDIISRKIIGDLIKQSKETNSKEQLKLLSAKYRTARIQLLEDLQNKSCTLPAHIVESIEEDTKHMIKDKLNDLITLLINERLI